MSKCTICNTKKGKRECIAADSFICSSCCGQTRNKEKCSGCPYFDESKPLRKYNELPQYTNDQLKGDEKVRSYAHAIETGIVTFDSDNNKQLKDETVIRILQLLLDKMYYNDEHIVFDNAIVEQGFTLVESSIREQLSDVDEESIIKAINSVLSSVRRKKSFKRDYLNFINDFL